MRTVVIAIVMGLNSLQLDLSVASPAAPLSTSPADEDLLAVLEKLKSANPSVRAETVKRVIAQRVQLIAELTDLVAQGFDGLERSQVETQQTTISLIATLRAVEATPVLVRHLSYHPISRWGATSRTSSLEWDYPCAVALARIGTPTLPQVLAAIKHADDPSLVRPAAVAVQVLLGTRTSIRYSYECMADERAPKTQEGLRRLWHELGALSPFLAFTEVPLHGLGDYDTGVSRIAQRPQDVTKMLRTRDPRAKESAQQIYFDRQWLIRGLVTIVKENVRTTGREGVAADAIFLLGKLRAAEAVPFLVENICFQIQCERAETPSPEKAFPCVEALVEIGPRLLDLDPLLRKVQENDNEQMARCAATVLHRCLGPKLAIVCVKARIEGFIDSTQRARMRRLCELVEDVPQKGEKERKSVTR